MKVLTLTQPWASLVAIGAKEYETRSWTTGYRGEIAIHAAAGLAPLGGKRGYIEFCTTSECIYGALNEAGLVPFEWCETSLLSLPFGAIIATAELYHIETTDVMRHRISEREEAFGDYSPGRYTWILRNVRGLDKPILAKGKLGLWEFDLGVASKWAS